MSKKEQTESVSEKDYLAIWTIYNSPLDYPGEYVARKFLIKENPNATNKLLHSKDLKELQRIFEMMGLYRLPRHPGNEPQIVESWL